MPSNARPLRADEGGPARRDEAYLGLVAERFLHELRDRLDRAGYEVEGDPPERSQAAVEEAIGLLVSSARGALAVDKVAAACALSPLERRILLLAASVEVDSRLRHALGQWPQLPGYRMTIRLAQELWGSTEGWATVRGCFGARAPLRRNGLLSLANYQEWDDSASAADSEVQAPDRVLRFLMGDAGLDPYLRLYARLLETTVGFADLCMPRTVPDQLAVLLSEAGHGDGRWWGDLQPDGPLLLQAVGGSGSGRYALCEAAAEHLGLRVLQVDLQALGHEAEDYGHYLNRLFREATLQRAMPVFVNCSRWAPGDDFDETGFWVLSRKLEAFDGPAGVCLDKAIPFERFPASRRIFRADLEVPPAPYRQRIWQSVLPPEGLAEDVDVWMLAKVFNFGGGGVKELLREATNAMLLREGPDGKVAMEDFMEAGRELQSRRMGKLTKRMLPRTRLHDLIVPPRVGRGIEEIINTVRYRHIVLQDWGFGERISSGKGMAALFSGPPGTGKSMAAQVISRECGMNLFRVNLAMVVSKFVGETEERLAKVFEEAKESHSILLFDEADALFAKRSKIKSAQDKYANLEVNFLLQEVEGFEGMVVLTTNLEAMIDKAFLRRLNFRLFFPKPDPAMRLKIWKRHIPPKAPFAEDIDWLALAEDFDFTGGYIKNSMLRAAQRAAEGEGLITHELLCRAAEAEMAETGRVIREVYQ